MSDTRDRPSQLLSREHVAACAARQARLSQALQSQQLDALLITSEKDIHYLTGFVGHESLGMALANPTPPADAAVIISDSRYDEFLEPWRAQKAAGIVMGTRHRLFESVRDFCNERRVQRLGVQAEHLTIAGRNRLAEVVGAQRLVETTGLLDNLRRRKDGFEVALIERAIEIAERAMTAALEKLRPGLSELEFSAILEYEMKSRGAMGASFTPIIGAGPNSSVIHYMTGQSRIRAGDALLVDWGATLAEGMNSDLTRTYGVGGGAGGGLPRKLRAVYPIVLEAQLAAIEAIGPGKVCADIDRVARDVIERAGYGEYFGHGLGHGLGLDVHEGPYFNNLETSIALEPGMVMTVEPGIYLPGVGGVRIEDNVLVTDDGCRVLSNYPKTLDAAELNAPAPPASASVSPAPVPPASVPAARAASGMRS